MGAMHRLAFAVSALVLALGVGCAPPAQTFGGKRTERPPQKIVSLSPGTTEIVGTASLNQVLKGRTQACDFPSYITGTVPVVAGVKPDYERIAGIQPDLILYDSDLYGPADVAKIEELKAKTLPFAPKTIDEYIDWVGKFAAITNSESTLSQYVDKVEAARALAASDKLNPVPKIAVVMGGGGVSYVSGKDGFLADAIRAAGGEPVGAPGEKFVTLNPETLAATPPDIVFVPVDATKKDEIGRAVDAVRNDPRMAAVPAVKNGKLVPFDGDVLLRRGARVDRLIDGLHRAMARLSR